MKKTMILMVLILMFLFGCNKDSDEDQDPTNYFSLDGIEYSLSKGYFADDGIYLMSDGLSISGLEQVTSNPIFQGTGNLIRIDGITGQSGVSSGTFDLNLVEGKVYVNWDPTLTTSDYYQKLDNGTGTCTISLDNLNCILSINGTLADAKTIVTAFNGLLVEVTE